MKFLPLTAVIVTTVLLAGCRKEKSLEEVAPRNICDYAPYSQGSFFEYELVNVSPTDTLLYTMHVRGDSLINEEEFSLLEDDLTGAISLFRCGNGDYVQLADVSGLSNAPTEPVKTTYLKENLSLGQTWREEIPVTLLVLGDVVLTIDYTIIQKGTGKTVRGVSYKDVMGVRMDVSIPPFLPPTELSTNYYAKGLGLIQADTDSDTTRLKSYTIR
jgi:hypothetical protein